VRPINPPNLPGVRKAKYTISVVAGMTSPNPVRKEILNGRRKFGDRFSRIRLKAVMETSRQANCQRRGWILLIAVLSRLTMNAENYTLLIN